MRTEEQIVYQILNIVHGGMITNDSPRSSERLARDFLRKHRASKMYTYFDRGHTLDDYVFQSLGNLEAKRTSELEFSMTVPAIVHFDKNYGIKLQKGNLMIPLLDGESYELSKENEITRSFPKAKMDGQSITVFIGYSDPCNFLALSKKELTVESFKEESSQIDDQPKVYVNTRAVLYDPSYAPGYDWTKDPYPCPSEIIDQITTSTLARDYELMIRQRTDISDNSSDVDPNVNPNDV